MSRFPSFGVNWCTTPLIAWDIVINNLVHQILTPPWHPVEIERSAAPTHRASRIALIILPHVLCLKHAVTMETKYFIVHGPLMYRIAFIQPFNCFFRIHTFFSYFVFAEFISKRGLESAIVLPDFRLVFLKREPNAQ